MPVNDDDARSKAKALLRTLHNLRARGASEPQTLDEIESAIRTFATAYASTIESELHALKEERARNKDIIAYLRDAQRERARD